MLYPQNGDRIVAIDSVTSLHAMYSIALRGRNKRRTSQRLELIRQRAAGGGGGGGVNEKNGQKRLATETRLEEQARRGADAAPVLVPDADDAQRQARHVVVGVLAAVDRRSYGGHLRLRLVVGGRRGRPGRPSDSGAGGRSPDDTGRLGDSDGPLAGRHHLRAPADVVARPTAIIVVDVRPLPLPV